jgi:integrase
MTALSAPPATRRTDGRYESRRMVQGVRIAGIGRTAKAAREDWLIKARRFDAGDPLTESRVPLRAYIERVIETSLPAADLAPRTIELYSQLLRTHVPPEIGKIAIGRITPQHIERILLDMKAAGKASSTRRNIYAALRKVFALAVRDRLIAHCPVTMVRRPKADRTEARSLDAETATAFAQTLAKDRLGALWILLLTTGLRRGEAIGLHWTDLDLDAGTMNVRRQLIRTKAGLVETPPKSEKGIRTVHLAAPTVSMLRRWRAAQSAERLALGPAYTITPYVFTTESGTWCDPRNASAWFAVLAKAAGVDASMHTMRHTAASILLASNRPAHEVAVMLGHHSPVVTLEVYAHVLPKAGRESAEILGRLIGPS